MKQVFIFSAFLFFTLVGSCQSTKIDTTVVKFPFSQKNYGWPFDNIKIETENNVFHIISDTLNRSILCIELDKKGCIGASGIYNLSCADSQIVSTSRQRPYPPYEVETIYFLILTLKKDGLWAYFKNGNFLKKEFYRRELK